MECTRSGQIIVAFGVSPNNIIIGRQFASKQSRLPIGLINFSEYGHIQSSRFKTNLPSGEYYFNGFSFVRQGDYIESESDHETEQKILEEIKNC